jgi:hypothetical protein
MNANELSKIIHQVGQYTSGLRLYESRYFSRPVDYAQSQLQGRTHYTDPDTLRFFHSRIVSAQQSAEGLLFWIVESCSANHDNTARGFRPVVFDIFGEVIYRPDLSNLVKTSDKARALYGEWFEAFDLAAHYREALEARAKRLDNQAHGYREALESIEPATA